MRHSKFLLALFLFLFCTTLVWGRGDYYKGAQTVSGTACTLLDQQTNGSALIYYSKNANNEYGGVLYTPASDADICQIDLYIFAETGDPSVNDYYFEIWSLGGSNELSVLQGRSAKVDGVNGWSDTWVSFTFSPSVSLTGSTTYAVVHKAIDDNDPAATVGELDASNYIHGYFCDECNTGGVWGGRRYWLADFSYGGGETDDDPLIKIYSDQ